jgi:hypothetical protein
MVSKHRKLEPPHQTLDEVFRYEFQKRSTNEGIASAALQGDRTSLRSFAGLAAVAAESATVHADVGQRLADAMWEVAAGAEPNDAFGWTRKRRGSPGARSDIAKLTREWVIGQHVAGLLATTSISEDAALAEVADKRHASKSLVRHCWLRWQGLEKTPR